MEKVSHREYLIWQCWFEMEWNTPNRTDFYLMQIAHAIWQVNSKRTIPFSKMRLDLVIGKEEDEDPEETIEEYTAASKARWGRRMTSPVTKKTKMTDKVRTSSD